MHDEAKTNRKHNQSIERLIEKYNDDMGIKNLKKDGISSFKNFYDLKLIEAVKKDALKCIDDQKISRVRNRNSESKDDIQQGVFKYFSREDFVNPDFKIEEKANLVSIAEPFKNIPSLYKLVFNEKMIAYAASYFNAIPMVSFTKITMSYCNSLPDSDTQWWHVDFGAKNILKAVVYLNDVNSGGGPFSFIKGSHKKRFRGWHLRSRYDTEKLQTIYERTGFYSAIADAGDCVLADTSGFHKGEKPTKKSRLCLIFNFTMHPEVGFPWSKIKFPRNIYKKLSRHQRMVFSNDVFDVE